MEAEFPHGVTLVLGGGWKLGCAFHAGVVLAMEDAWGLDARRVDTIIGTSSGAVVAGLLGAGMSPPDLFAREVGEDLSADGEALMARRGESCDLVVVEDRPPKLHRTLGLSARGALAALLPRGRQPMQPLVEYFDDLVGPRWPTHIDLRFVAVDLGTGQRVALGRDSGATVGQAIAASCSVPGVSQPMVIVGREYIDGAIYSINNADLAMTRTVVVSAPLSANRVQFGLSPLGLVRNAMRVQTATELRKLGNVGQLIVIEPTALDIAAMGPNLNANPRRALVSDTAYETALASFRPVEVPELRVSR